MKKVVTLTKGHQELSKRKASNRWCRRSYPIVTQMLNAHAYGLPGLESGIDTEDTEYPSRGCRFLLSLPIGALNRPRLYLAVYLSGAEPSYQGHRLGQMVKKKPPSCTPFSRPWISPKLGVCGISTHLSLQKKLPHELSCKNKLVPGKQCGRAQVLQSHESRDIIDGR